MGSRVVDLGGGPWIVRTEETENKVERRFNVLTFESRTPDPPPYVVLAERPEVLEGFPADIRWMVSARGLDG